MAWTRITSFDDATELLPAWFAAHMLGTGGGSFGFLLTTGDVLRFRSISAIYHAPDGSIFADVLLDNAGVPHGIDLAWRPKHFLGSPIAGASLATVNLAHVIVAVEFSVAEMVAMKDEAANDAEREIEPAGSATALDLVPAPGRGA